MSRPKFSSNRDLSHMDDVTLSSPTSAPLPPSLNSFASVARPPTPPPPSINSFATTVSAVPHPPSYSSFPRGLTTETEGTTTTSMSPVTAGVSVRFAGLDTSMVDGGSAFFPKKPKQEMSLAGSMMKQSTQDIESGPSKRVSLRRRGMGFGSSQGLAEDPLPPPIPLLGGAQLDIPGCPPLDGDTDDPRGAPHLVQVTIPSESARRPRTVVADVLNASSNMLSRIFSGSMRHVAGAAGQVMDKFDGIFPRSGTGLARGGSAGIERVSTARYHQLHAESRKPEDADIEITIVPVLKGPSLVPDGPVTLPKPFVAWEGAERSFEQGGPSATNPLDPPAHGEQPPHTVVVITPENIRRQTVGVVFFGTLFGAAPSLYAIRVYFNSRDLSCDRKLMAIPMILVGGIWLAAFCICAFTSWALRSTRFSCLREIFRFLRVAMLLIGAGVAAVGNAFIPWRENVNCPVEVMNFGRYFFMGLIAGLGLAIPAEIYVCARGRLQQKPRAAR